jgi:hypothetical protein
MIHLSDEQKNTRPQFHCQCGLTTPHGAPHRCILTTKQRKRLEAWKRWQRRQAERAVAPRECADCHKMVTPGVGHACAWSYPEQVAAREAHVHGMAAALRRLGYKVDRVDD